MNEREGTDSAASFDKGDRAAIVGGRKGVGVRGAIFWVGENKYGDGMRFGLRGDDGEAYFVDEGDLGPEDADVPEPPPVDPRGPSDEYARGVRVRVTVGDDLGQEGEIFWVGESKFTGKPRYGIRCGEEVTVWADHDQVTAADEAASSRPAAAAEPSPSPRQTSQQRDADLAQAPSSAPRGPAAGPPTGTAPALEAEDADRLPPEAFDDDALPPEAYEDEIPF